MGAPAGRPAGVAGMAHRLSISRMIASAQKLALIWVKQKA